MEIFAKIQVYLISWTNFDSKKNNGKKSFSCRTKASKSCLPMMRICLYCPITKEMYILRIIQVYLLDGWTLILRKMVEKKACLAKPKHQYHPNDKIRIIVRNYQKNSGFYENPSLSHLTYKFWIKRKWWKEKLFLPNHTTNIIYPNVKNVLIVPDHKKDRDYYKNPRLS